MRPRVGIVVPTLGKRIEYLTDCLASIREAGEAHICLVTPNSTLARELIQAGKVDQMVEDPGGGLAAAINFGISSLPKNIDFVNWLGDDDLLTKKSIYITRSALELDEELVMVFGSCLYIDALSNPIFLNRSGQWAVPLLRCGPDLIPQPGALFRRSAFEKVGGLATDLSWAFDFDLFIKLSKIGKIKFLNETLANFRWHSDSLSVSGRSQSALEASKVRRRSLPKTLRLISLLWEYPVRVATIVAANLVSHRIQRMTR